MICAFSLCGCRKREKERAEDNSDAVQRRSRLDDKEYLATLAGHQESIQGVACERNQLKTEMEALAGKIKAALPADVSEEDFKAALAADEQWQELLKREAQTNTNTLDVLREARETIRERMLREQREGAEASAGK